MARQGRRADGNTGPRSVGAVSGRRRCAAARHDTPPRRAPRGAAAQPRPQGRRARRLSGAAPARCHHERPAAHARARVLGRRRGVEDAVQHRVCGPEGHGARRAWRSPLPRRHASRSLPTVAPGDGRRAACRRTRRRSEGPVRPGRGHRLLPCRPLSCRRGAAGQRAVGLWMVGGRRPRGAHCRGARGRGQPLGLAGRRCRALRSGAVGCRAGAHRRALQRGTVPIRHAAGGSRRRRGTAPPRMARLPAPGRRPRPGKLAVGTHRVPLR